MGYLPRAGARYELCRGTEQAGAGLRPRRRERRERRRATLSNCALGEDVTSGRRASRASRDQFSIWHGALHPTRAHDRAVPLRLVIAYPYRAIPYPGERRQNEKHK
jgi:hypothetical protein